MAPLPLFLLKAGTCALLVAKAAIVARYLYRKYKQPAQTCKYTAQTSIGMEQTIDAEINVVSGNGR